MSFEQMIRELERARVLIGSMPATHEAQDTCVAAKVLIRKVEQALEERTSGQESSSEQEEKE